MKNKIRQTYILTKLLLKISLFLIFFFVLLAGFFLLIKKKHYETPVQRWKTLNKPSFNLIKFFGFKWNLIIFLVALIAGLLYRYPIWKLLEFYLQRKRFIEFSKEVHMAVISADVGRGKTLLLSILANSLPHGRKKVGFVSNVPDAELLSYNDINFHEPISQKDNYRLNKYFFLDETNFWIDGVEFHKNRLFHKGVAFFLQIIRHHKTRLWISATRDNHVWVAVREIVNYYVKLGSGGVKHLLDIGNYSFYTLHIQFYTQSWELYKEFNILIPSWDFQLYDSYWLSGTSSFRPILEETVEHFQPKYQELNSQEREWEDEVERQFQGKQDIILQLIKNDSRKDLEKFFTNFYNSLSLKKPVGEVPILENQHEVKKISEFNSEVRKSEKVAEERLTLNPEPKKIDYRPKKVCGSKPKNKNGRYRKITSLKEFLENYEK